MKAFLILGTLVGAVGLILWLILFGALGGRAHEGHGSDDDAL